jgi:hypothetical protein
MTLGPLEPESLPKTSRSKNNPASSSQRLNFKVGIRAYAADVKQ